MRAAVLEDAEALSALIRLAFAAQEAVTDPPPSAVRETADSVRDQLAAGGGIMLGTPPIGGLIWSEVCDGLYVGRLAVHPLHRKRGIGARLLAAAEEVAQDKSLGSVNLSTRLILTGNRRFFAAAGFVEIAEHAHSGYDHPTFVSMEKRLDGKKLF